MSGQQPGPASEPRRRKHVIAVTEEDNGELAEDVVAADESDEASARNGETERAAADRVVHTYPAPETEGRRRPNDPVPGTLPRT